VKEADLVTVDGAPPPGQMDPFLLLTSSGLLSLAGHITQEQKNTAETI